MSDISGKIRTIIAQNLEIKEEKVTEGSRIVDDLGADSLDIIEFFSVVEEKFDIKITGEDANKLITVGDLVSYIEGKTTLK